MVRFIPRPSPAMVVACLALVVALGGTSYAVVSLAPNSVGTAQLRANAVVSSKVRNRSLLAVDFKAGQIPTGPPGPKGDKGDPGTSGVIGYELISARSDVANQLFNSVSLSCPAGKKAVGGGGATAGGIVPGDGPYIIVNQPSVDGTGWLVQTARGTSGGSGLLGYAICATVS